MQDHVEIRHLKPTDNLAELTRLLHAAYRPLAECGMHYVASFQDEGRTLERAQKGECYVAVLNEQLVGTVTLSQTTNTYGTPWYDRPDVASFGQFAVLPKFQGSGLGSALMDLVEKRARANEVAELALDTSENALGLIARYQRRGYRFIENTQWPEVNYRSVILSKSLHPRAELLDQNSERIPKKNEAPVTRIFVSLPTRSVTSASR